MMADMHEAIYGDTRRVHEMRVQAQGRIAARRLRYAFVDVWAEPLVAWLVRVVDHGVSAKNAQRWGRRH